VGAVQRKARSAKRVLVVGLYSSGTADEQMPEVWCGDWGMTGWTYCGFCMSELPICNRFVGEREASEAICQSTTRSRELPGKQLSARDERSETYS